MSPPSTYAEFAPYIHVDKHDRLELKTKGMPAELLTRALSLESRCARCQRVIHPFRCRNGTPAPERRTKATGGVFISLVCPIPVDIGCSRSPDADLAKAAFIREIAFLKSRVSVVQEESPAPVLPHPRSLGSVLEPGREPLPGDAEWCQRFLEAV